MPQVEAEREAYAQQAGEDGFALLDALEAPEVSPELRQRSRVVTLRQLWQQHFERRPSALLSTDGPDTGYVRVKPDRELPPVADNLESPYDLDARYRRKRGGFVWTGYMVHVSETCGREEAHLLTHVHTTPATVHEAQCTEPIQQALVDKDLAPKEHLVDAAYVDAALLVSSRQDHGIDVIGPTRPNVSWQTQVEGAYRREQSAIPAEPPSPVITGLAALAFRKLRCENTPDWNDLAVLVTGFPMSIVAPHVRKHLSADALFHLVRHGFASLPDHRLDDTEISLTDALMSAFAMFFLKAPRSSPLTRSAEGNLHTIYGIVRVPCDTYMRAILDPVSPKVLRPVFKSVFGNCNEARRLNR